MGTGMMKLPNFRRALTHASPGASRTTPWMPSLRIRLTYAAPDPRYSAGLLKGRPWTCASIRSISPLAVLAIAARLQKKKQRDTEHQSFRGERLGLQVSKGNCFCYL